MITDYSLEMFAELPMDVYVIQTMRNAVLPAGMTIVEMSSLMQIPRNIEVPAGVEIVRIQTAIQLPAEVLVSPDCEIVSNPPNLPPLPHVGVPNSLF